MLEEEQAITLHKYVHTKNYNLVKDLLPLYIDEVVCDDTKEFIENHIKNCEDCAKELQLMKTDLTTTDIIQKNMEHTTPILKIKKKLLNNHILTSLHTSFLF